MVALAAIAALVAIQQQPQVTASVDRTSVAVAETIMLTIRVSTLGNELVRIIDPVLAGLEISGSREATQVSMQGGETARLTTRELRLRATRPGTATIGAVRVRQGDRVGESAPIAVEVIGGSSIVSSALDERVQRLLERLPPPERVEDVGLTVTSIQDSVVQGGQVDLVVAAWFPRDVRTRLRAPPTLSPPEIQGGWLYDQRSPSGIAASRLLEGRWYDLFVTHQVAYPLTERRLTVGSATVSYSLPLTYSFLSRELRHEVQSEPFDVTVVPLPKAGRPAGFDGAVGADLSISQDARPREVPVGEAATITVSVSGRGNVTLWPEPQMRWPAGVRVYPGEVETEIVPREGWVAGTKRFRYVVIPDSVGPLRVPSVAYPYFDLERRDYAVANASPLELVSRTAAGAASRATPPKLIAFGGLSTTERVVRSMPPLAWVGIIAVPPLLALLVRGRSRLRFGKRRTATPPETADVLDKLDREFRGVLTRLVPEGGFREGDGLADALRAAGVEAPVAEHAARVRDRLRQAVYGAGGPTDPAELGAEVQEVLRALLGGGVVERRRRAPQPTSLGAAIAFLLVSGATSAAAQSLSPESMYELGAFRVAADSFAARAEREPAVAAHWFNLGNALYRLGEAGRAQVAWMRASRLAPRDPVIRRALQLTPPPDRFSSRTLWISPVTESEAFIVAAAAWVLAWMLVLLPIRVAHAVPAFGVALVATLYGLHVQRHYREPLAVVVGDETPLRQAPYGSAPATSHLPVGAAVTVTRGEGPWLLVARGRERGWLTRREVVPL